VSECVPRYPGGACTAEVEGGSREDGFTLIELMVVLLILAILLAIAIPTFLGVTNTARDRSAQSTLTNALTETQAAYQDAQAYPSTSPVTYYSATDPQFNWQDGTNNGSPCTLSGASKCVSVMPVDVTAAGDLEGLILAVMSSTGTCWYAVNLQTNPAGAAFAPADAAQFLVAGGSAGGKTAGTFFAKSATPAPSGSCWAGNFATAKNWGGNYALAPAN